jgi:hypothetical protein
MEIKKQMQLSCLVIGHKREIFAISQLWKKAVRVKAKKSKLFLKKLYS